MSLPIQPSQSLLRLQGRNREALDQQSLSAVSSMQRVAQYAASLETSFYRQDSLDEVAGKGWHKPGGTLLLCFDVWWGGVGGNISCFSD